MSDALAPADPALSPPESSAIAPDEQVSIQVGDQILTGVGETAESLRAGLPEAESKPESVKPTRGQRRYDALTFEAKEAQRKADAAEAKAAELEARLKALETPAPAAAARSDAGTVPVPASLGAVAPPAAVKPKLAEFVAKIGETYATYEDAQEAYIDARDAFTNRDLDATIRDRIEADRASRTFQDQLRARREDVLKAHPDFDAALSAVNDVWFPRETLELLTSLPNGGELQYQLAKNKPLAQHIASLRNMGQVGYALAQLSAGSAVASPASTAVPVASLPPPPYQPVGSGSKTTVLSAVELAERGGEDYDASGFRETMRASRRR